jgi:4-amino-4-deoxy-L-arabinose transferase-like glycosyltransferase
LRLRAVSGSLLAAFTLALLLPFLGKALHIDDPLFVWCARHIQSHPLDFYGFNVNWDGWLTPMSEVTQNPPLAAYYMALVGAVLGWSETALHAGFLLPAVALVLGTYLLAESFCSHAEWAALATATAPVFLVSSTSVMCDTMMVAFWIWSMHFWLTGLKTGSHLKLSLAVLLAAACCLTKYFGIALVPLLLAASRLERRRLGLSDTYLLVPVFVFASFHYLAYRHYGQGFLLNAMSYAENLRVGGGLPSKILTGLAFSGGCMIILLAAAPLLWKRRGLAWGVSAALVTGLTAVLMKKVGEFPIVASGHVKWLFVAQLAVLAVTGASLFALAISDWLTHKTAAATLLFLWVGGTFVFAFALNWTVSGRNVLPMLPAVAVLVIRRLEHRNAFEREAVIRWWRAALAVSLGIALLLAHADFALANSARSAASALMGELAATSKGVAFQGHWGFQYYMEQQGAVPLERTELRLTPDESIVVPRGNSYLFPLPGERVELLSTYQAVVVPWLSTMNGSMGAGYYSDGWGPLPFVFGAVPAEEYRVYRVK